MNDSGKRDQRQLCLTNPEVAKIAVESVLRILRENPDCEIISVSQMDWDGWCVCEQCRAIDTAEGSHSGTLIAFVNQVAAAVEKEFPEVLISTLAYQYTVLRPKTIRPRKNVAICLATDSASSLRPFVSVKDDQGPLPPAYVDLLGKNSSEKTFKIIVDEWSAVSDNLFIWDYVTHFGHYLAPMPNMDVIAENIRYFVAHNAKGILTQGDWYCTGGERELMRAWVTAKLMWDPSRDVWALMQDFIWGYYGQAAPAIAEYNRLLDSTLNGRDRSKFSGGYSMDVEFLSKEFIAQAEAIFARARKLAENEDILRRVELDFMPILYVRLMRGPEFVGERYPSLIDEFERIAKREHIHHLRESNNCNEFQPDAKCKEWRDDWRVFNEVARFKPDEVQVWPLSNKWRFAVDPEDIGVSEKWFNESYDDQNWTLLRSDLGMKGWEDQGFPKYDGVAWYRQTISIPSTSSRKLLVYFGAVDEEAWIYLNGKLVFEHTCAATHLIKAELWNKSFLFDVSDRINSGENTLAVRVHDAVNMGGIWRPAYLIATEQDLDLRMVERLIARTISKN